MGSTSGLRSVRDMFELKGKNYIVTGGAQGIGFAIARGICEMGGNVAILDIQAQPSEAVKSLPKEFGKKVEYLTADVSDETALRSAFGKGLEALGGVDGVVTCAGIAIDKPFTEQSWSEAEKIQKINVLGTFFTAQMAVDHMQKEGKKGSLVFISSICAHVGLPGYRMTAYNASKGGVKMLTSALATELGPKGIRVNSIAPAFTDTEMTKVARDANPAASDFMWSQPPLKTIGTPNDMVGAAIYLLSDASSYTTGTEIMVTGGIHLGRGTDYAAYA